MAENEVNAGVKIVLLPTAAKATYAREEAAGIQEAIKNRLLLPTKEPYHKVHVGRSWAAK